MSAWTCICNNNSFGTGVIWYGLFSVEETSLCSVSSSALLIGSPAAGTQAWVREHRVSHILEIPFRYPLMWWVHLHDAVDPVQQLVHVAVDPRPPLPGTAHPPTHHTHQPPPGRGEAHQRPPAVALGHRETTLNTAERKRRVSGRANTHSVPPLSPWDTQRDNNTRHSGEEEEGLRTSQHTQRPPVSSCYSKLRFPDEERGN